MVINKIEHSPFSRYLLRKWFLLFVCLRFFRCSNNLQFHFQWNLYFVLLLLLFLLMLFHQRMNDEDRQVLHCHTILYSLLSLNTNLVSESVCVCIDLSTLLSFLILVSNLSLSYSPILSFVQIESIQSVDQIILVSYTHTHI